MKPRPFTTWIRLWLSLLLGLGLAIMTHQTAGANTVTSPQLRWQNPLTPPPESEERPSMTYARVLTGPMPVYNDPVHASLGLTPTRVLEPGYVWVTLANTQTVQLDDQLWHAINPDEYVQTKFLEIYQPTQFRGIEVSILRTFAWMIFDAWTAPAPGQLPGDDSVLLTRYTVVPILGSEIIEERHWYQVGGNQWVEQGMVGIVSPKPRPAGVGPTDKWIEVDLYEQTLAAYQGDQMVYATLVSSGLPWWQTEQGLFQIWIKVKQAKMSGRDGYPDYYFLEDVPWTMYFNGEFALHGAYWHDRFGIQHSHGCVNMTPADAKWLFEWSTPAPKSDWIPATAENPGTWVWVHDSGPPEIVTPESMSIRS